MNFWNKLNKEGISISDGYTLFLDRDGVINHEKEEDYIHHWNEFRFYDGVLEAFSIFGQKFKHIIVVTNQRGIGRGLSKLENVVNIHLNLIEAVQIAGGKIDCVYFCSDTDSSSKNRKPNAGMGQMAKIEFPDIEFEKSIMVGNKLSDMQFGRNLGVQTIYLTTTHPSIDLNDASIDRHFPSLLSFAKSLA